MILDTVFLCVYFILLAYRFIILVDIILSWIPNLMQYKIFRLVNHVTSWIEEPFRGHLVIGRLDFTPIITLGLLSGISAFCLGIYL